MLSKFVELRIIVGREVILRLNFDWARLNLSGKKDRLWYSFHLKSQVNSKIWKFFTDSKRKCFVSLISFGVWGTKSNLGPRPTHLPFPRVQSKRFTNTVHTGMRCLLPSTLLYPVRGFKTEKSVELEGYAAGDGSMVPVRRDAISTWEIIAQQTMTSRCHY